MTQERSLERVPAHVELEFPDDPESLEPLLEREKPQERSQQAALDQPRHEGPLLQRSPEWA